MVILRELVQDAERDKGWSELFEELPLVAAVSKYKTISVVLYFSHIVSIWFYEKYLNIVVPVLGQGPSFCSVHRVPSVTDPCPLVLAVQEGCLYKEKCWGTNINSFFRSYNKAKMHFFHRQFQGAHWTQGHRIALAMAL